MAPSGDHAHAVGETGDGPRGQWMGPVNVLLASMIVCLGLLVVPRLFGYATLVVHSGSMGQAAPAGSLVLARPLDAREVRVSDVVLVRREGAEASPPVLHRVVSLAHRAGKVIVQTKGDSNSVADPSPYQLRGRTLTAVVAIPHAGGALSVARTPVGWTLLVAVPATVLLWMQLRAIWFPARRRSGAVPASEHVRVA